MVGKVGGYTAADTVDDKYYQVARPDSLAERLAGKARDVIYDDLIRLCAPDLETTVLDVGVSDVLGDAANVLERRYLNRRRITAVGLGAAEAFQRAFPEIAYRQIAPNVRLPFEDGAFGVATSNAVLEHVGCPENQRYLVREMLRVARQVFITVPHRFFPIEHHTAIPFLHWTDVGFRLACGLIGKSEWARQENLILMSRSRLRALLPAGVTARLGMTGVRLGPFSSNIYLHAGVSG